MNYKVKCVAHKGKESYFTIGKIYDVLNNSITSDDGYTYRSDTENIIVWLSKYYQFEYANQYEICITFVENETRAIFKCDNKITKRVVARCSGMDEFDFRLGAKVALNRLFEEDFRQHLQDAINCRYLGAIGNATAMKDIRGEQLFIGDTVTLVGRRSGCCVGSKIVCSEDDFDYIMGIRCGCHRDGSISDEWIVIKERSYTELKHNEIISGIKAILKED